MFFLLEDAFLVKGEKLSIFLSTALAILNSKSINFVLEQGEEEEAVK